MNTLDGQPAKHFAAIVNALKGQMTMLFITHAMPKVLVVDEVVKIGKGTVVAMRETGETA